MAQSITYPVDTDQFEDIRESDKFYADKTGYLYDLIHVKKFRYVFLARPRRFDKSAGARFQRLIHNAFLQTGRKIVIIIDEYDSAMLRYLYHPQEREQLRNLFGSFSKC